MSSRGSVPGECGDTEHGDGDLGEDDAGISTGRLSRRISSGLYDWF